MTTLTKPVKAEPLLKLTPCVHPEVSRFINQSQKVDELVQALGSPLNIVFPELVTDNLRSFQSVFNKYAVTGRVYFAHKTNRSTSIIRRLAAEGAHVDVSSSQELGHVLSCGFTGNRLEATGPKNDDFLLLSILHGLTVNVDSINELERLLSIRNTVGYDKPINVLVRLCGFESGHSRFLSKSSRFGVAVKDVEDALLILEDRQSEVKFLGFSFHIDSISPQERAIAIENCWELFDKAIARGLDPRVLNIGGGYKINYLENENEWYQYITALKQSVLGAGPPLTWQGNSFGMSAEQGTLRGSFNSYTYYDSLTGAKFLDELLSQRFSSYNDTTFGALLRDNMIELWIEPGRSLVDQCGITIARVNSSRGSSRGENIVCLNMKRQDIAFLDQEIFVDPLVIYKNPPATAGEATCAVFFAGNLCLESDLIYRHKTFLPKPPEPGDLVVFINTAGYLMDFSASQSIMQPIAEKVAVWEHDDTFNWAMDSQYSLLGSKNWKEKSC